MKADGQNRFGTGIGYRKSDGSSEHKTRHSVNQSKNGTLRSIGTLVSFSIPGCADDVRTRGARIDALP